MWAEADILGLFSNNVVSFSRNVVLRRPLSQRIWSRNEQMFSGRERFCVLGPLHITFEQLLEEADLYVYNRLLRPGIMATILTELLAAQAIQLTASTHLPLSFIIAEARNWSGRTDSTNSIERTSD